MSILSINREWDFVIKEIDTSNKYGTDKRELLFEFQILLFILLRTKNLREKRMLTSIFQERKERYKKSHY